MFKFTYLKATYLNIYFFILLKQYLVEIKTIYFFIGNFHIFTKNYEVDDFIEILIGT